MSYAMGISVANTLGYLWIRIPEISMFNYERVESRILHEIDKSHTRSVVVDLSDTVRLYSSGIGLLIRVRRHIAEKGGSFYVVNISDECLTQLKAANLHKILSLYQTQAEFEVWSDEAWSSLNTSNNAAMECVCQLRDDILYISAAGTMTGEKRLQDEETIHKALHGPVVACIVDATGISMIDSEGIGGFYHFITQLRNNDVVCTVYGCQPHVAELLEMFGFEALLKICDNEAQCRAYIERVRNG